VKNVFGTRLKQCDKNVVYKELIKRFSGNPILTAENWPYPAHLVFNPAATIFDKKVLLLVRVEGRMGFSHLTKVISDDGITGWQIDCTPTIIPQPKKYSEEIWGIEDPRITRLEELDKWAIVYTSYSSKGPVVSIALTSDFKKFERLGAVMPPEDKDAALFPRKFGGKWVMIHRPLFLDGSSSTGAHIWLSTSEDLKNWNNDQILVEARRGGWWDANKIGICTPPLETSQGWLILYHGVRKTVSSGLYRLGLVLLDINDPTKVLRRSDEWIFGPKESYETHGDVPGVIFPCGWIYEPDTGMIKIYYGCADTSVGLAMASLDELLEYIEECPQPIGKTNY